MSDYLIVFARTAEKELDSLPLDISSRISPKIQALTNDPRPPGCVKLKGQENRWRIRIGDYRVIYNIDDENFTIKIVEVGHRREIYER
ncbi:type II toxin-antitoxin system RelE/ParE family toxin [Kamptonema animale CS-326]|uniref:type II toxin-antitoxin system RelE family toxin n=1 Tax=Kamptonema animale TaxID=92934 RepID=UPI00232CAAEB|nr:type II toxin-antitoxin system RelE/ParE family toxin [Kamptonema animale]MDB9510242.1 type II toxin-antitoxin system RelE/ParE family toxin [Kamptonema animale CS-326]